MSGSNPFRRNVGLGAGEGSPPFGEDDRIAWAEVHFPALDTGKCSNYLASELPIAWLIRF